MVSRMWYSSKALTRSTSLAGMGAGRPPGNGANGGGNERLLVTVESEWSDESEALDDGIGKPPDGCAAWGTEPDSESECDLQSCCSYSPSSFLSSDSLSPPADVAVLTCVLAGNRQTSDE
jgi:hypothetical protein